MVDERGEASVRQGDSGQLQPWQVLYERGLHGRRDLRRGRGAQQVCVHLRVLATDSRQEIPGERNGVAFFVFGFMGGLNVLESLHLELLKKKIPGERCWNSTEHEKALLIYMFTLQNGRENVSVLGSVRFLFFSFKQADKNIRSVSVRRAIGI